MRAVEQSSKNEAVIQQAANEVRAAQASIAFLEDELRKLELSQQDSPARGSPMRNEGSSSTGSLSAQSGPPGAGVGRGAFRPGQMTPSQSGGSMGGGKEGISPSPSGLGMDRPLPAPPPGEEGAAKQKNYTQLGELIELRSTVVVAFLIPRPLVYPSLFWALRRCYTIHSQI